MSSWIQHHEFVCPVDIAAEVVYELEDGCRGMETAVNVFWGQTQPGEGRVVKYLLLDSVPDQSPTSKPTNPKDAIATNRLPLHLVSGLVKAYQAIAHFLGNVKYGAHNYRSAGVRYSVYASALSRHVDAWWEGEEDDPADGTPHLANAQACLNILIEAKYTPGSIDDRPPRRDAALAEVRARFEALMPKIREKYAHMNPHHFSEATDPAAPQ